MMSHCTDNLLATFFGSFIFYLHMFFSIRFKMTICQIISKKKMILKLLMLVLNYVKLLRTSVVFHWYKIHHICFYSIGLLSNISNVIFITLMYQVLCQNEWHTVRKMSFLLLFFRSFKFYIHMFNFNYDSKWRYVRSFQKRK